MAWGIIRWFLWNHGKSSSFLVWNGQSHFSELFGCLLFIFYLCLNVDLGRFSRRNQRWWVVLLSFPKSFYTNFYRTRDVLRFLWLHASSLIFVYDLCRASFWVKTCIKLTSWHLQEILILQSRQLHKFNWCLCCKREAILSLTHREEHPCSSDRQGRSDRFWVNLKSYWRII